MIDQKYDTCSYLFQPQGSKSRRNNAQPGIDLKEWLNHGEEQDIWQTWLRNKQEKNVHQVIRLRKYFTSKNIILGFE